MSSHKHNRRICSLFRHLVSFFRFLTKRQKQVKREHRARSGGSLPKLLEDEGRPHLEEPNSTHTPASLLPSPAGANGSIHVLSDDVLMVIFDHCRGDNAYCTPKVWIPLVHVCQRWREIVYSSPRHLHLLLFCDTTTPAKKLLHIWPPMPIAIHYSPKDKDDEENVIAALEQHSSISWIVFNELTSSILKSFVAVMHKSFPALRGLQLQSVEEMGPVLPDSFLGGCAPQLQSLFLEGIAFPALPKLLFDATQITKLWLLRVPDAGYIEPDVMATCLTALSKLEELHIGFQSPRSMPLPIRPRPRPHTILPALTYLTFRGDSKYLEDLVTGFMAPNLDSLNLWFFMDFFVIPHLYNFVSSAKRLKLLKRARIELYPWSSRITLGSPTNLDLGTRCDRSDQRVSWMAQLCNAHPLLLSHVEILEIIGDVDLQVFQDSRVVTQWLELFRPFTAVQDLYISKKLGPLVSHALKALGRERVEEVLPALRNLSLAGLEPCASIEEAMEPFVAARRLCHRPVVVERWEQEFYWDSSEDW